MLVDTGLCDRAAHVCHHRRSENGCVDCKVRLISVCSVLALPELEQLEALSQHLSLDKGQALFGQGETASSVFNVIEGALRLTRLLPDGRRQVMGFALPGDFLGLALQERYSVSAEALGPVKTCRFARHDFAAMVEAKPHLLRSLHERAGYELSLAQDQMLLLGRRTAEEKVAAFLLSLRDRFARAGHSSITVELPMGRQDMADYLGLTMETVSRMLTRLDRAHAILLVPGGARLLDPAKLERLAAS
ncbi:Crp/Fnr family transcriptional regulator [Methylobacterium dankookense]|jgi:CRP/FNR family transcriptional regulator|uniref:Transcriptional activatory protein AadR n=1 Tax=Methylobacterium dankookense TaxID=560405 RepID=A0A564G126_9HYPH|nr:helix-turn-helix domain-containing protein [Methylobacterium dankookense]GJD55586.1 Transcriptional activatory protein AadR [Methylobacterium dankookense]VUF13814.1 Transcriptional activatory protein AadR [Methylobacterium dankookense]